MKPITHEWVEKAEEDWAVALLALNSPQTKAYNAICFHTQQCAEKYLKGQLQEEGVAFPYTHDLISLLDLLVPSHPLWTTLRPALLQLKNYAVAFRYPGDAADVHQANDAVAYCRSVRDTVRQGFGLPL